MQEYLFPHFSSPGHNAFVNDVFVSFKDKTDSQDPFKRENFVRQILMTMAPYGLILKIVSEFYHFDKICALFFLPIYCTLWVIRTPCFSRFESWKMNLFSHYFINFSFTFLFIVISINTMVTILLLLLLSLIHSILFLFIICLLIIFTFLSYYYYSHYHHHVFPCYYHYYYIDLFVIVLQ